MVCNKLHLVVQITQLILPLTDGIELQFMQTKFRNYKLHFLDKLAILFQWRHFASCNTKMTRTKGVGRKISRRGGATEKTRSKIALLSLPLLDQYRV